MVKNENRIRQRIPNVIIKDGEILSHVPKIYINGKLNTSQEAIKLAFTRYPFDSVIDAMLNKKIVLNL